MLLRPAAAGHQSDGSRLGAAGVYRLACRELQVADAPHDALLAALVDEGEEDEEEARTVTLPGLDESHVCALALTLGHLQSTQPHHHHCRQAPAGYDGGRRRRCPTPSPAAAATRRRLLRLHLPGCRPGREGMRQLGMAIAESDAVVGLSFRASPALGEDEELLPILAAELRRASSACGLRALSLGGCGPLLPHHADALVAAVLSLPQRLSSLVLSDTHLGPDALVVVSRLVRAGARGPTHIALDNNPGLGDEGTAALGGALAARLPPWPQGTEADARAWGMSLERLDLSHTRLGDEGLGLLVDGAEAFVRHHPSPSPFPFKLRRLALDGNLRLTPVGLQQHLRRLLRQLPHTQQLHLSITRCGGDGHEDALDPGNVGEGPAGLAALFDDDTASSALASLDVRGHFLDAVALTALARMVAANPGLAGLSLTLPPLPTSGVAKGDESKEGRLEMQRALEGLLDAVAASSSLQRLGLEGSRIYLTDGVVAAVLRAERALVRNRKVDGGSVGGAQQEKSEEEEEEEEESRLSTLVLSILSSSVLEVTTEEKGREKKEEDVATTVRVLTQRMRSVQELRDQEALDTAILESIVALLSLNEEGKERGGVAAAGSGRRSLK